jgi:multiple sugar transport system substrate-binding protein
MKKQVTIAAQSNEKALTRRTLARAALPLSAGAAFVAACGLPGGGPAAPSAKEGTIRTYIFTNDVVAGQRYFNDTVFARFNKEFPKIKIDAYMAPFAEVSPKMTTEVMAGTGPDLFQTGHPSIPGFSSKNVVRDLADYVKRDSRNLEAVSQAMDIIKESLKDPKGRVWAMPATLTTSALVYNKALFDRHGIKPPDASLEWNPRDGGSFVDLARRMTRPGDDGEMSWGYWWTGQVTADTQSWLRQNEGTWLDATGKKADLLKPANLDAFQMMGDLPNKYRVSPQPKDAPLTDAARGGGHWLFFRGKAAMFNLILGQESAWPREVLQGAGPIDVQVVPLPKGKRRAAGSLGNAWLIGQQAKQPEASWEFLKWWSNDAEAQAGVWTDWKYGLPPARKAWTDPRVTKSTTNPIKDISVFFEPFEKGFAAPFEINEAWANYIAAFNKHFVPAMNGLESMPTAIQNAQRDVQAVLDEQLPKG